MPRLEKLKSPRPPRRAQKKHGTPELYRLNAWRETSELYRKENPLCEVCKHFGKYTDITPGGAKGVTDHIVSTAVGGSHRDPANFMAMCTAHHNMKRGLEAHADGPLIPAQENKDGELIPVNREDIYEKLNLWR